MAIQLQETTFGLLAQTPLPISKIAEGTGLGEPWLLLFKSGRMGDPGVNKIEKLYCFLAGRDLQLVPVKS